MDEIFLQISIPAFSRSVDIKVSKKIKLYELINLLYELISSELDVDILKKSKPILCDKISGDIFNINMSIAELGLRNGSQLMLI